MRDIDLRGIDLNLLVALHALLSKTTVTAAAQHMRIGQPAMSHALGRLRDLLGDPILVRVGRNMQPTPRAAQLKPRLAELLHDLTALLNEEHAFDAQSSTQRFRLVCGDILVGFLPTLLAGFEADAPHVQLDIEDPKGNAAATLLQDAHGIALGPPQQLPSGVKHLALANLDWVVCARKGHPYFAQPPSAQRWAAYPHVVLHSETRDASLVDLAAKKHGIERPVGLRVSTFLAAPHIAAQTDYLLTGPQALLQPIAEVLGLQFGTLPFPVPALPIMAYWPARTDADPAQQWFRRTVTDHFLAQVHAATQLSK